MTSTKMTRKGQVTIPVEIREKLNLQEGDILAVHEEQGRVVMESQQEIVRRLAGAFNDYACNIPPLTPDEMDEVVAQAIVEDYLASESEQ